MTLRTPSAPASVAPAFDAAVHAHLRGDLEEASRQYRAILDRDPRHAETLNNLGAILADRRELDAAADHFERAIAAQATYPDAHHNLGLVRLRMGESAAAVVALRTAVAQCDDRPDWWLDLGNACLEDQRSAEAVRAFDRALVLRPNDAVVLNNRAIALRGLRRLAEATASARAALAIRGDYLEAWNNLGLIQKEARDLTGADDSYAQARALHPGALMLAVNHAVLWLEMGRIDEAARLAHRLIDTHPDAAAAWNIHGNCQFELGDFAGAEDAHARAAALDPTERNAQFNLAVLALLRGDLATGLPRFESRRRLTSVIFDRRDTAAPEWDGGPLDGRDIFVYAEQGLGDLVQFVRYVKVLKTKGARRVIVEALPAAVDLLHGHPDIDLVVQQGDPMPAYDTWVYLMSLPFRCGTTIETIPATMPYLDAPDRIAGRLVAEQPGPRVGIVWSGNPEHQRDVLRSLPLAQWAAILATPGVTFFSLQKGPGRRQLEAIDHARVIDLDGELRTLGDAASAIAALDLVITVDTAIAHVAGALGVPVWTLLPHAPDFRWLLERSDSPWYPTMRLWRQPAPGDWTSVVDAVAAALPDALANAPRRAVQRPVGAISERVTLESADRRADGQVRFALSLPIRALHGATRFAEYEAELLGAGAARAVRDVLDAVLDPTTAFIDLAPGLGTMAASTLTSPHGVARVLLHAPADEVLAALIDVAGRTADGLAPIAAADPSVVASLPGVVDCALRLDATRPSDELTAWVDGVSAHAAITLIAWDGGAANSRGAWQLATARAMMVFRAEWRDGEAVLDLVTDPPMSGDLIALAPAVLDRLHRDRPAASAAPVALEIDWECGLTSGWGTYGAQLALHAARDPRVRPTLLVAPTLDALDPLSARALAALAGGASAAPDAIRLHALGNGFHGGAEHPTPAARHVGVVFFEDMAIDAAARTRALRYPTMITGSAWNQAILEAMGHPHAACVLQGIDTSIFHPAPARGILGDRFVVFSGGKLEFRKGQDLVIAAFRRFHARHPDALLMTAWHNHWPQTLVGLDAAGHVRDLPDVQRGRIDVVGWLARNGIPVDAVLDLGAQPQPMIALAIREASVGLFPNRAEGGTNLVAMETMACGVPAILSANTGHLDLLARGAGIAAATQRAVTARCPLYGATDGWGESDVDELVEALERSYADHTARQSIGAQSALAMQELTWSRQVAVLIDTLVPA